LEKELIGEISAAIVASSAIPYIIRLLQGKIEVNPISWIIWSILGLAILLSYKSSGAEHNIWVAVFGFINPTAITIIALFKGKFKKVDNFDIAALVVGLISIVLWCFLRESEETAQIALYVGILADAVAAIATFRFFRSNPMKDRPFAWYVYAVGYGLAVFAVPEYTVVSMILPLYMLIGAPIIALPLVIHRIKHKVPAKLWF